MNFFTLDLYHRFNSPDVDEAVRADADWEDAIVRYKDYLRTYRDDLPPGAKKLAEEVNLHDAEVLKIGSGYLATGLPYSSAYFGAQTPVQIPYTIVSHMAAQLVIVLRVADEISIIIYSLWNWTEPQVWGARAPADPLYWLYDEIVPDQHLPRHFWHRILFSDESIFNIPFIDCVHLKFDSQVQRKSKG
jgi:hypothetical protein